jgi:hypothetical protein
MRLLHTQGVLSGYEDKFTFRNLDDVSKRDAGI